MRKQVKMKEYCFDKNRAEIFFAIFSFFCFMFALFAIFLVFIQEDLFRILTPFLGFFPLLITFAVYLFLVVFSLLYIPFQIKRILWRAFIPLIINSITFLSAYYFYDSIRNLRVDLGFYVNKNRFNQSAQWIEQSIKNGDVKIEDGGAELIILPSKYWGLADRNRVWVTRKSDVTGIFFNRGGGMFEYYPGYMYQSDNTSPPIEDGDIVCVRKITLNWYDCY